MFRRHAMAPQIWWRTEVILGNLSVSGSHATPYAIPRTWLHASDWGFGCTFIDRGSGIVTATLQGSVPTT